MNRISYALIFFLLCAGAVSAQDKGQPIIKTEVLDAHIMFERQVWRRMDLKERQNKPLYSKNAELSRLLISAVREGLIKPYRSDSCVNLLTDDEFEEAVSIERQQDAFGGGGGFDSFGGGGFDSGFGGGFGDTQTSTEPAPEQEETSQYDPIPPELFSVAYLREDVIFDRNRSRMLWYIRAISIALPAGDLTWNPAGFEKKVAHFRYQDVVDLFRGPYAEKAIWFNNQNQAQHRNMADAFELRLFRAPITKISNAEDADVRQQTTEIFEAILLSQEYENQLMEYESELWEY